MKNLPRHSGELLELVVDLLRVKAELQGRKNCQRWRAAPLPALSMKNARGTRAQEGLAREVVGKALPAQLYPSVFGLENRMAVELLSRGLLRALHYFDEAETKLHWVVCVSLSIATVLGRLNIRLLKYFHGGTSAQAPDWLFAGRRPEPIRPVVQRALAQRARRVRSSGAQRSREKKKRDSQRKLLSSLLGTDRPHLDGLHELAADDRLFPFKWALQELFLRLEVDAVVLIVMLSTLDNLSAWAKDAGDDMLEDVLAGGLFGDDVARALLEPK